MCSALISALVFVSPLSGQGGGEALFLLLPIGAQAVGMGEAVVAQQIGSEGVWWNPAAIAGGGPAEVALHHSETIVGQGNVATFVIPSRRFGTFAPSINIMDLEKQIATDEQGLPQGVILPTNVIYSLTYAAAPLPFLRAGMTVKHMELRVRCTGQCTDLPAGGTVSNGVDLGAQLSFGRTPLTVGVATRNLGVEKGSTSPARLDVGASYRIEALDRYTQDVQVYGMTDVVSKTALDSASLRLGGDVVFEQRVHLRGGYIIDRANGSGASIGFGIAAGKLVFDLARSFGGLTSDGDKPPTYFSLRYQW